MRALYHRMLKITRAAIPERGSHPRWDRATQTAPYSDFLTAANPEHLNLTIFASGIAAESKYTATHEGFELEQTLTP